MSFADYGPRSTANYQTLADMSMLDQVSSVDEPSSCGPLLPDVTMGEGMASLAPADREPSFQAALTSLALSGYEVSSPPAQTSPALSNHADQDDFPSVNDSEPLPPDITLGRGVEYTLSTHTSRAIFAGELHVIAPVRSKYVLTCCTNTTGPVDPRGSREFLNSG